MVLSYKPSEMPVNNPPNPNPPKDEESRLPHSMRLAARFLRAQADELERAAAEYEQLATQRTTSKRKNGHE